MKSAETVAWICIRSYDRGISMVASDSGDRDGRAGEDDCVDSGISGVPSRDGIFAAPGYHHTASTFTEDEPEGIPSHLKKTTMLVLAVTLHNIPEGMAVGVTFAGVLTENTTMSMTEHLPWRSVLQFRIFRKGQSFPCHCKVRKSQNQSICIRDTFRDRGTGRSIF